MPIEILRPCRIICEGAADAAFFKALTRSHGIDHYEADCAKSDSSPNRCAGKGGITDTLRGLQGFSDIHPGKLKGVIIAVDTDRSGEQTLRETIRSIHAVEPPISCPANYLEIVKERKKSDFFVSILGIPWHDELGNLDTLLFRSMQDTHGDLMEPLQTFCDSTKHRNEGWSFGAKSKMRLRCMIASSYEDDPGISLSYFLSRTPLPVDLRHESFNRIVDFLNQFAAAVIPENT